MDNREDMRAGYIFSAILHAIIVAVCVFGLPDFFRAKPPVDQPIAVQLVNQADLTRALQRNPHPVESAKLDTPPPPVPSEKPTPQPPDILQPPPPPPPAAASTTEDDSQDNQPTPPPEPTPPTPTPPPPPAPAPPPPPKPAPAPPPPKPKPTPPPPKPKPAQPKPTPKPKKQIAKVQPKHARKAPKANQDNDVDSLLKNLSQEATQIEKTDQPPKKRVVTPPPAAEASAQPDAPLGSQLTTSELDTVRAQIEHCWNPPGGGKDENSIVVPIRISINPDGTVSDAQIIDNGGHYYSDPLWRAIADSALRAVHNPACSPLKMPPDKYSTWKTTTLNFSPQDLS